ncbi:MAG TPA: cyclic nucleotide-binding domain-containing protein, partial [Polyangiaceae bacterium]|nr:cyclic nucleotide-binding domain-containing protein [Polyangiaceae bacterium]
MSLGGYPAKGELDSRRGQMFPALTAAQVARVATFGREQSFDPGVTVWEQGDSDVPFYVVLDGQLEVVHPCEALERPVTVHEPGEFTGELALLLGRRSLVRGRARSRLRVLRVDPARFRALVQTDSELSEIVMRAFILRRLGLLSEGWGDALVIGSQHSAATLRLQDFLVRNGQPCRYVDVDRDPDVQGMLDHFRVGVGDIPILICRGERVLRRPSDAEVADCLGLNPAIEPTRVFDVVV